MCTCGQGVEDEVEDDDDLAFLERLSAQNNNAPKDEGADGDDTRDSDSDSDGETDTRAPDPDDPDIDQHMYAFLLFCLVYLLYNYFS